MSGAGKNAEGTGQRDGNGVVLVSGKMHVGSTTAIELMLEEEGVHVQDDKIVNFKKHFWDPVLELE